MSNRTIKQHAYLVACLCKKTCGELPETIAFKRYATKHEQKRKGRKESLLWCDEYDNVCHFLWVGPVKNNDLYVLAGLNIFWEH